MEERVHVARRLPVVRLNVRPSLGQVWLHLVQVRLRLGHEGLHGCAQAQAIGVCSHQTTRRSGSRRMVHK